MIRLADYVMNFLVSHGVKQVFLLPGGGAMHLNDALGRCENLQHISFLHEQALAIAVEAYGQHTNTPGVGLVTSGPGSTNAITAVAAGYIDSTPMFILSGQAKRSDLKTGTGVRQMGSQEVDIVSMVSCITKYAVTVLEPEKIRYHLERAWHEATSGRMGPVWLDVPLDVQGAMIDEDALEGYCPSSPVFPEIPVSQLAELLHASERPLLLIGNGVKLAGCSDRLIAWAKNNHIPMLLTWKTADLLAHDDPMYFGFPGIMGARYANFIVQNADLLIIAGSRLDPSLTAFKSEDFGRNAKKVMADIDEAEIRKIKNIDVRIVAPAERFVAALETVSGLLERPGWLAHCRSLKAKYPVFDGVLKEPAGPVDLYCFTDELFNQLVATDVIVPESSGAAGEVTYQGMKIKQGQKVKNAAGLGSMGFGLPYAIGASLAHNRRRTVLINGDGAFQMNIQELETVVRLGLPIKMFILDNAGYGSIVTTQRNMFNGFKVGSDAESGLTLPDVCRQAQAYGIRTLTIADNASLKAKIAETLSGVDPVICKVCVTPNHVTMPKVQAQRLPDGRMVSKPLEDMFPYLPEEELRQAMRFS
ncbi:MAG: thiamine pyrophosphate-binding protein [Lentisphaerae bacterium]|jgi:acetolactate synthase-1/2/3 large subunit|nr:thiamine pyrophosphate-binding protein [Lentisphaerota bacterium]